MRLGTMTQDDSEADKGMRTDVLRTQQGSEFLHWYRRMIQIALNFITSMPAQIFELLQIFDALGNHAESQTMSQIDNGSDYGRILETGMQITNKGLIDLETVDGKTLQAT